MRVLITGSRDWPEMEMVHKMLDWTRDQAIAQAQGQPLVVVHGDCRVGADAHASNWAYRLRGFGVHEERHPAADFGPWPAAGPKRNQFMVSAGADMCLAFIAPCRKDKCRSQPAHGSHGATGTADMAEAAGIYTIRLLRSIR